MTNVLSEESLLDPHVPAAWQPVLEGLREFIRLEESIRQQPQKGLPSAEQEQQLFQLHECLVAGSAALLEPSAVEDISDAELNRLFARSVLFLTRLHESVMADHEILDTVGSETLSFYEVDFYGTDEDLFALQTRLKDTLGISTVELAALEGEVEHQMGDARRKLAVVRALREEFGVWNKAADVRPAVHRMFSALFPGVPLDLEEVDLIVTGTLIFWCLPFDGEELTTDRFRSLPEAEQRPIREFLRQVNGFKQERFAHFPAFGFLPTERLDSNLLERLGKRAGIETEEIARELCRSVTVLPVNELDKYVVHDVWGHSWQASMLQFEHAYEEMAGYAAPLVLEEESACAPGTRLRFADCFQGTGAALQLDVDRFRRFVHNRITERVPVALSAALAEMMADAAEFKFLDLHPQRADAMPSSSLLKSFPNKLDLVLQDVSFYFSQATKSFRFWASRAKWQQRTCRELVQRGATAEAAEAAVCQAVAAWEALVQGHYAPRLNWHLVDGDLLQVNLFTLLALNFLGIHRAILETYRRLEQIQPSHVLTLKSYKDLLVIGASVFFEADRATNLWRVDEYLSLRFVPLVRRVGLGE